MTAAVLTPVRRALSSWRGEGAPAALSAGFTAFLFYAFAPLPLQVAVAADLGLSDAQASTWIFAVWASGAVASITLSVAHRQPIAITWSVLGLVYLGTVGADHTFEELVGANLVAGVAILALALAGVGERVMRLVPLPVVLGMFAGSVLEYVTGAVSSTVEDGLVGGAAVAGYLVARAAGRRRLPPVAVAVACAAGATALGGRAAPMSVDWGPPDLALPGIAFSADAILSVSPVLAALALGLGNVQGLGYLVAQGYRVPANRISIAVGIGSIVNALLGGHQATVGRATTAIVGGPDAGPAGRRYLASVVASIFALVIALSAGVIVGVVGALPASFVAVVAGLALLPSLQDSIEKAFAGELRFGALTAFVVAATPFSLWGMGSSSWALVAGLLASLAAERPVWGAPPAPAGRVVGPPR